MCAYGANVCVWGKCDVCAQRTVAGLLGGGATAPGISPPAPRSREALELGTMHGLTAVHLWQVAAQIIIIIIVSLHGMPLGPTSR